MDIMKECPVCMGEDPECRRCYGSGTVAGQESETPPPPDGPDGQTGQ